MFQAQFDLVFKTIVPWGVRHIRPYSCKGQFHEIKENTNVLITCLRFFYPCVKTTLSGRRQCPRREKQIDSVHHTHNSSQPPLIPYLPKVKTIYRKCPSYLWSTTNYKNLQLSFVLKNYYPQSPYLNKQKVQHHLKQPVRLSFLKKQNGQCPSSLTSCLNPFIPASTQL